MAQNIIAVFGDEFFPKIGVGASISKRKNAANNIIEFFRTLNPELVYLMPTAGVCVFSALVCKILNIPYILISPFPGFFDTLPSFDKEAIVKCVTSAKTVILLNQSTNCDRSSAKEEAVKYLTDVSDVTTFFFSKETSDEFQLFMNNYNEKYLEKKVILELPYDSRKVLFK